MALPDRCSCVDLGALCEFERLIDNLFRRDGAPRPVFLWRLGSNMFRIIGHTSCHRAGFSKHIAPKFFCPPLTYGLCESCGDGFCRCHDRRRTTSGTAAVLTVVSAWNTGKSCWTNTSEDIIDTGTAAGIYDLRRLKIRHCAEPVGEARSVLVFCLSITPNVRVTPESLQGIQKGKPTWKLPASSHTSCYFLLPFLQTGTNLIVRPYLL